MFTGDISVVICVYSYNKRNITLSFVEMFNITTSLVTEELCLLIIAKTKSYLETNDDSNKV